MPYNEKGGTGSDGNNKLGLSEGLSIIGGAVSGKGLDGAKDVISKRNENERITYANIAQFETKSIEILEEIIVKNDFKLNEYDALSDINLEKDKDLSESLIEDSESDVIINVLYSFGYIMKNKNFGLSKEYQLALKATLEFSDAKGFIGNRTIFVKSSKRKTSDGKVPAFESDDFKSVLKSFKMKLRTEIKKVTS